MPIQIIHSHIPLACDCRHVNEASAAEKQTFRWVVFTMVGQSMLITVNKEDNPTSEQKGMALWLYHAVSCLISLHIDAPTSIKLTVIRIF